MTWLVFGDPPHPAPLAPQVANLLGVLGLEVRGKLSCPLPEVWFAARDPDSARAKVADLAAAGARAMYAPAEELAHIPDATNVQEFEFTDEAFTWGTEALAWKSVKLALLYRDEPDSNPGASHRADDARATEDRMQRMATNVRSMMPGVAGFAIAGALGDRAPAPRTGSEPKVILELFGTGDRRPCRARIVKDEVSYRGLGPLKQAVILQNWSTLLRTIGERVPAGTLDRRGEKTKVRPAILNGIGLAKILEDSPRIAGALATPGDVLGRFVAWQRGVR